MKTKQDKTISDMLLLTLWHIGSKRMVGIEFTKIAFPYGIYTDPHDNVKNGHIGIQTTSRRDHTVF